MQTNFQLFRGARKGKGAYNLLQWGVFTSKQMPKRDRQHEIQHPHASANRSIQSIQILLQSFLLDNLAFSIYSSLKGRLSLHLHSPTGLCFASNYTQRGV